MGVIGKPTWIKVNVKCIAILFCGCVYMYVNAVYRSLHYMDVVATEGSMSMAIQKVQIMTKLERLFVDACTMIFCLFLSFSMFSGLSQMLDMIVLPTHIIVPCLSGR